MAPTVAPRAQVRRARPAVWVEHDRNLADAHSLERRLDHHLAGELHASRAEVHALEGFLAKRAQSAVRVADARVEEGARDPAQHRVAQPAMQPRHGPRLDPTREATA